jgi:hypothetical protein
VNPLKAAWTWLMESYGISSKGKSTVSIGLLRFKTPNDALEFACKITPPMRAGLVCVAVIDDVENLPHIGQVAAVRVATPEGPKKYLAVFPDKDDALMATSRITDLCAVMAGAPILNAPQPLLIVAILVPEFKLSEGLWSEQKRLGKNGN